MNYAKRLAGLKKAWGDSKPAKGNGQLPAGNYQLQIQKAVLEESKANFNKGHMQVVYHLTVATGPLKGRKALTRVDLESPGIPDKNVPSGLSIFKGHLDNLQLDMPKDLTEKTLKALLASMVGIIFNGAAVQNAKGFTNIYINDLVNAAPDEDDDDDEDTDEEEEEEDEDEDDESEDEDSDDEEEEEDDEDSDSDDEEEDDEDDEDEDDEDDEEEEETPAPKTTSKSKTPAKKASPKKTPPKKSNKKDDDEDDDWDVDF